MNTESRLAKLEGINKSRSEKVANAKAYAIEHFGTDSPAALKSLYKAVKFKEDELTKVNEAAQQHLTRCLDKLENNQSLSETDTQVAENFIIDQNRLKEEIATILANVDDYATEEANVNNDAHSTETKSHTGSASTNEQSKSAERQPSSIPTMSDINSFFSL